MEKAILIGVLVAPGNVAGAPVAEASWLVQGGKMEDG